MSESGFRQSTVSVCSVRQQKAVESAAVVYRSFAEMFMDSAHATSQSQLSEIRRVCVTERLPIWSDFEYPSVDYG